LLFKNDYEAAAKKLVDAKRKGKPLPETELAPAKGKAVNIMDALRDSLAKSENPAVRFENRPARRKKAA
jgi:DNA end-binding protein Ku